MSDWLPLHENHAINVMALVVTFAEPIPSPMFRRAYSQIEASAISAGLVHRQPLMNAVQFSFQQGVMLPVQQTAPGGSIFSAYFDNEALPVSAPQLSEQLQIEPSSLVYRTWSYVSWSWQKKRFLEIVSPLLNIITGVIAPATIRLEYQDRFVFDGNAREATPASLLRSASPYLCPHIFEERGMWHSHTGLFIGESDISRKLLQINVDAVDEGEREDTQRWVNITTARENRYPTAAATMLELDQSLLITAIDEQHAELKTALRHIISDKTAERIYLEK